MQSDSMSSFGNFGGLEHGISVAMVRAVFDWVTGKAVSGGRVYM